MVNPRRVIPPVPGSDENVRHIPLPHGRYERPTAVQEIDFRDGIAWEGPTRRDTPPIPKPEKRAEEIPVPSHLPEIQSIDAGANLNFIARMLASVLLQPRSFVTGNMTCLLANRGYQLPDIVVPTMANVIVKAWFTNAGQIYVAYRQSDAQSVAVAWPLIANEGVGWRIPNVNRIYIMATVAGEGASYTVEQK